MVDFHAVLLCGVWRLDGMGNEDGSYLVWLGIAWQVGGEMMVGTECFSSAA